MRRLSVGVPCGAFLVGGLVLFAGCGPIEFIAAVPADASGALAEAKHVNGDKYAIYEMTAAGEYIHKSRELAGYARFQSSVAFGRKAGDNARKAKKLALEKAALPEATEPVEGGTPATPVTVAPVPTVTVTPVVQPVAPAPVAPPAPVKPAAPAAPPPPPAEPLPTKVIIVPVAPPENPSK